MIRAAFTSLRARLLMLVFVAVCPSLVLVFYLGVEQRQAAADHVRSDALRLTRLASANQERVVESTHQLMVTLATLPQVQSGNRAACKALFSNLLAENPLYANIGIADSRGNVLTSAVPVKGRVDLSERAWFQKSIDSHGFTLGSFQTGRADGKATTPTLDCAYPVFDRNDRLLVVIYAAVHLGWWNQLAAEAQLPEGAAMEVIDGNATVLARYPDSDQWVGQNVSDIDVVRTILEVRDGTSESAGLDGVTRFYTFSPLRGVPEGVAYVSVGISRAAAFAQADRALRRNLIALLLGAIMAGLAAWFGGNIFVMRRVNTLVEATRRWSAGNLHARTGVPHEQGELGQLARGLDEMAASLEARQGEALRAEAARRESEERFLAFMNHSPAVAYIKDDAGRYVYYNKRFEDNFCASPVDLQGKTDYEWLTEKTAKHLTDSDREVLETGRSSEVVETIPTPDGKPRTWMVFKFPVRDAAGRKFLGAVAIDVTERQLLEEQLRQSQKMEAVGKLAAGVAHDFNNLLTVMQGYSELIIHRNSSMEVVRGQVGEIHKAAIRAGRLTRQLLAFTRQEVVQPKILDLNGVVTDMHKMLKRLIGADVEFSFLPGSDLGRVKADPGQIEQIVMNLVVNARDAMPKGGKLIVETGNVEMDVSQALSRPGLRPGPYVLLAVTDTGMGMDAETRSRIFEPFFTTKDPGKGTGLGLATVYGIVKQCEGDVQVYSEPGQGATFKIYIPRVQDAAETGRSSTAAEGLPEGSETVLLVDNERPVAAMVRATLESLGYTVIEAHNGPEALEAAARHTGPIHLVMTDMVMPQMNGPEFAARFAESHPGVPILYMSGYAEKAIIHQGLMDPNASFLAKPFGPATLAQRVREVLDPERRMAA